MSETDPDPEDAANWEEACRREDVVRKFVLGRDGNRKSATIKELAQELGLSRATAYRMIAMFQAGGTVTSLMGKAPGRRRGHRALDPKREALIQETIKVFYLKPTRPSVARLVHEIRTRCLALGLPPPNWRTVKARITDLDTRAKARKRGESALLKSTMAVPGEYRASRPLEIVQIDHTRVDLIVVDEQTREPLGRPWITLAMDVFTRMVTGFYLTMDNPSRLSVSLCLLHAVFDKGAWLREREINTDWPIAGLPEYLHADNGADFRSKAFIHACRDEGINIIWRPPGTPHFGGHIERLIGTQMGAIHFLPGTTQSNPSELGEYDSAKHSSLTLRELERFIALEITSNYHHAVHAALRRPPIAVWKEHEGGVPLRLPKDRMRFLDILFARKGARSKAERGPSVRFALLVASPDRRCRADEGQGSRKIRSARSLPRLREAPKGRVRRGAICGRHPTRHHAEGSERCAETSEGKGRREVDMRTIVQT